MSQTKLSPIRHSLTLHFSTADLAKRALENIGNCPQTLPANFKASFMPGVKGIAKIPTDLWWWVPLPQTDAAGLCTISTLQKVPDDKVGGTPPVPIGYVQDPNAAGKKVSVDHICEYPFFHPFQCLMYEESVLDNWESMICSTYESLWTFSSFRRDLLASSCVKATMSLPRFSSVAHRELHKDLIVSSSHLECSTLRDVERLPLSFSRLSTVTH